jgi:hypothetical protein
VRTRAHGWSRPPGARRGPAFAATLHIGVRERRFPWRARWVRLVSLALPSNMRTARALGLTVSNSMQLLADEVIE